MTLKIIIKIHLEISKDSEYKIMCRKRNSAYVIQKYLHRVSIVYTVSHLMCISSIARVYATDIYADHS